MLPLSQRSVAEGAAAPACAAKWGQSEGNTKRKKGYLPMRLGLTEILLLAIIALLGICFSLTVIVSRQEARIKRLIQILSIEHNELKGSEEEEDAATERDNK